MVKSKKKKTEPKKKRKRKKYAFPKFELFKKLIMNNPGMTPTEAVIKAGYRCNRKVASIIGSQNLAKLKITMSDILERMGLTDEQDAADLERLRNAKITRFFQHEGKVTDSEDVEDNTTQLKALELTEKLKGRLINKTELSGTVPGGGPRIVIIRYSPEHDKKEKKPDGHKTKKVSG